jgi:hypothetical protein
VITPALLSVSMNRCQIRAKKGQEVNQAALGGFKVAISATGWFWRLDKKTFGCGSFNFEIDSNIATFRTHNFLNSRFLLLVRFLDILSEKIDNFGRGL